MRRRAARKTRPSRPSRRLTVATAAVEGAAGIAAAARAARRGRLDLVAAAFAEEVLLRPGRLPVVRWLAASGGAEPEYPFEGAWYAGGAASRGAEDALVAWLAARFGRVEPEFCLGEIVRWGHASTACARRAARALGGWALPTLRAWHRPRR
jgi:hypothetical protein